MIGLLPSLNRAWRRAPSGYRPGAALDRLARNLEPYACERLAPGLLRLTLPQGPQIEVSEQVQGLFMAHIVSHRFRLQGVCAAQPPLTLDVVTGGWLRRCGVRYLLRQRHAA
ncbi:DUF3156 family protein, partial [Serratia marcescens]